MTCMLRDDSMHMMALLNCSQSQVPKVRGKRTVQFPAITISCCSVFCIQQFMKISYSLYMHWLRPVLNWFVDPVLMYEVHCGIPVWLTKTDEMIIFGLHQFLVPQTTHLSSPTPPLASDMPWQQHVQCALWQRCCLPMICRTEGWVDRIDHNFVVQVVERFWIGLVERKPFSTTFN